MIQLSEIEEVLNSVFHPEYERSVMELSLVQNLKYQKEGNDEDNAGTISFRLVFHRSDPMANSIKEACEKTLKRAFPNATAKILVLVDTKNATGHKKGELGRGDLDKQELSNVQNIIAIASGKGGVGKSSVAVNLAIALSQMGYKVGLLDADVYGPSVPKMTGTEDEVPPVTKADRNGVEKDLIVPIEKYGVKWMSIGYFAKPEQALIWRGPMACGALKQLSYEVMWGELDYLLIDLPPGTGDIHITMIQEIPPNGAIIVTTPQKIALADVEKGINMFRNKDVHTPILGIVENMSWFTPKELPENKYFIFGKDGGQAMADKYNVPLLGQIPIVMGIMEGGDSGVPAAIDNEIARDCFNKLAEQLV